MLRISVQIALLVLKISADTVRNTATKAVETVSSTIENVLDPP